jgi:hypothetical protein
MRADCDQGEADRGGKVALSAAGRPEQDEVGNLFEPAIPCARDHRHGVEREAVERLSGRKVGFAKVTLDAPAIAFGDLVLDECREKAGGGPSLLVGTPGDLRLGLLDRGQPQIVEDEPLGDDGRNGPGHATAPE